MKKDRRRFLRAEQSFAASTHLLFFVCLLFAKEYGNDQFMTILPQALVVGT